jgi:hypothetical protein
MLIPSLTIHSSKLKFISVLFFSDKTGKFPEYPSDDEGGSALLFKEKTPEEVELCTRPTQCFETNVSIIFHFFLASERRSKQGK